MRKNVLFLLSCISGAAIQLMATATPAEAAYRFVSGFHCAVDKTSYLATSLDDEGRVSISPNAFYTMCGLTTDEVLPPASISYLEVNGYDGSTNGHVYLNACVTFYTQHGHYCGPGVATTDAFTGTYALAPNLNAFHTYPDDYAFVWVLFSYATTGSSSIAGIYYE